MLLPGVVVYTRVPVTSRLYIAVMAMFFGLIATEACRRAGGPEERPGERPGMAYIAAGEFPMGSRADDPVVYPWEAPREQPQHPVYVDALLIVVFSGLFALVR